MPLYCLQTVVETAHYIRDAKSAGMSDEERYAVVDFLAANPSAGDLIVGSGGARKVRFGGRGKGRSGGYRVITYFGGDDLPVFLLNVFSKGERTNLTRAEINELRKELAGLARDYREGAGRRVKGR